MSDSVRPHRQQPTRLPYPWDSPGKNTGVGCHFLLQCMKVKVKVKSLSRVRLFATPWTAAYQAPPFMGFPRQEYWRGLPLPSPIVHWWGEGFKSTLIIEHDILLRKKYAAETRFKWNHFIAVWRGCPNLWLYHMEILLPGMWLLV